MGILKAAESEVVRVVRRVRKWGCDEDGNVIVFWLTGEDWGCNRERGKHCAINHAEHAGKVRHISKPFHIRNLTRR